MKALTLHQPWASLIGNPPWKWIENRSWKPPRSVIGTRIAIHAGQKFSEDGDDFIRERFGDSGWFKVQKIDAIICDSPDVSGIVATAVVVGWIDANGEAGETRLCTTPMLYNAATSPWLFGPYGWILDDVVRFARPIPCKGRQMLWNVPPGVLPMVAMAERDARAAR